MSYCLPVSSIDTPAYGPGFAPPHNSLDRFRDKAVRTFINNSFKKILNELDDYRLEMGVSLINSWENLFSKPDILIYLTTEPFEYKPAE